MSSSQFSLPYVTRDQEKNQQETESTLTHTCQAIT